jgi:hypothetical protein
MATRAEYQKQGYNDQQINTAVMQKKLTAGGGTGISGYQAPVPTPTTVPTRTQTFTPGQTTATVPVKPGAAPTGTVLNTLGAYNPVTGGYEIINPTVGVNKGVYSPEDKQSLWNKSGQSGSANMDAFYRKEDGSLGIKPEFVKSTNPAEISDVNSMNAYLNGVQNNNFVGNGGDKGSTDYVQLAKQLGEGLKSSTPENFSREKTLGDLRSQYGVVDLETQLTELDKQANDIGAEQRIRSQNEQNKPVAMGVIGGRVSEIERQQNERMDAVNRSRSYVASQLQVKNSLIKGVMDAKSEDYQTASARYDAEFSKNLQMITLARGIEQDKHTAEDKQADNARATIQTVYNTVTSGGMDPAKMTDSQKANISRLELQAGFPAGFVQNLYDKNPKGDIIYSGKETAADGNDYLSVVMKDKVTGETTTQKVLLGKSAAQQNKEAELKIKQQNADTAAKKKGTSGSKSTTSTASKTAATSKKSFDSDVASWSTKVVGGSVS